MKVAGGNNRQYCRPPKLVDNTACVKYVFHLTLFLESHKINEIEPLRVMPWYLQWSWDFHHIDEALKKLVD